MLTLLKISNIALIESLSIEFGEGLNLLTGETGSGKSIIVDSLGALTGDRVTSDLIKEGSSGGTIEGAFTIAGNSQAHSVLETGGIDAEGELIIRRDLSASGRNRIFVNGSLATQSFLRELGATLVDIHGQGEQAALYNVASHIGMLDEFGDLENEKREVARAFETWAGIRSELAELQRDGSERLQLLDVLRLQVNEITSAALSADEEMELDEEKRRLSNIEKLTSLSAEAFELLYDGDSSTAVTLERAQRKLTELSEFEKQFNGYLRDVAQARVVIEDLAFAVRDFRSRLEFSPDRLNEIEARLAEILRLKRKYGGSVETVLDHLKAAEHRLGTIETSEEREVDLLRRLDRAKAEYLRSASALSAARLRSATAFSTQAEQNLKAVSLERARLEVHLNAEPENETTFSRDGYDHVEFYFSANPGESPKPLAKVASGGEASRLMLILKTTLKSEKGQKTAVFDEVDTGIGGRVAESVGRKLKALAVTQQVLCVTHQPQIASLADQHYVVSKEIGKNSTLVTVNELGENEKIEEIARMLAGESITEQARENARAMLAGN